MNVVITGGAGFLGSKLADALLCDESPIAVKELLLVDTVEASARSDPRVKVVAVDLTSSGVADTVINNDTNVFFHLAAIVSGHAEADFDLGFKVNFDVTRALLETARRKVPTLKFVFTSTVGCYGGILPDVIDDFTALMPETTYGTTKSMCELMINDYSRKGFIDGRIVRLPTVSVRAGAPNKAVTSFASGIIREPLNGIESLCPVPKDLKLWLTSPRVVVMNIIHAAIVPATTFGLWRGVMLPGITVSVGDMVEALKSVAGEKVAALVRFEIDDFITKIVASFPSSFDTTRGFEMGFVADHNYADVIRSYICDDLKINI